jgi:hypothetical protein
MKTLDYVIENYKSETLDGRDIARLADFVPFDKAKAAGWLRDDATGDGWPDTLEWTLDNVLEQLKSDVDFGFEKALNQRGLSAGLMWQVVSMWNWILEEGLENFSEDDYAQYGLPLFKATALKYGFNNPIGDDSGTESKYEG